MPRSAAWLASSAVFLLAAAGTLTGALAYSNTQPPIIPLVRVALPIVPLSLRVDTSGSRRLRLNWNPESTAVQTAVSGVLHIQDGPNTTDLPLDAAQLAKGSVACAPVSQAVGFRLDVQSKFGPAEASLRVLDKAHPRVRRRHPSISRDEAAAYDDKPRRMPKTISARPSPTAANEGQAGLSRPR